MKILNKHFAETVTRLSYIKGPKNIIFVKILKS